MSSFEDAASKATALATATATTGAAATAAGFTSSGIAAGSVAAGMQAAIGNVAAGSSFALMQSIGAVGGFVGMMVAGFGYLLFELFFL